MKHIILTLSLLFAFTSAKATIRYVDKTGNLSGSAKTIQGAIDNSIDGDTVRILPGIYSEAINIGKNILVEGGGINNTTITTTSNSVVVTMTNGTLQWVAISAPSADGVWLQASEIRNCLVYGCAKSGIVSSGTLAKVTNCISTGNAGCGYITNISSSVTETNCIAYSNQSWGFAGYGGQSSLTIVRYCIEAKNGNGYGSVTNVSSISADPGLATDGSWRISQNSPCKNGGDPTLTNLDASRSDIGYYGGSNAPLLPYVTLPASFMLNADGTVTFDMLGKVGY